MAYMRPLDEQNQQQTQQGQTVGQPLQNTSSGGGQIVSSNPGVAAPTSANTTGQSPTRSGANWVNIDSYLNVNPSLGKQVSDQGNALLSKEGTNFTNASKPLVDAEGKFTYESMTPDEIHSALTMGSTDKIKRTLGQPTWSGPDSTGYDINASGNITDARQLANPNLAVNVLAKDAIVKGQYGLGSRTLDQSLLGADPNFKNNSQSLWNNIDSFVSKTGQRNKEINDLAGYDKNKIEESRNTAKTALDTEAANYKKDIDDKLKSQQAQADWSKRGYYDAYQNWYDNVYRPHQQANADASQHGKPTKDYTYSDLFGYSPIGNYEATPTTGNVGTDEDYKVLGEIGDLTGQKPIYSKHGNYALPTYDKDNGATVISNWLAQYGNQAQMGSPVPLNLGNNYVANQILGSGNVETPEQLARRLGLQ